MPTINKNRGRVGRENRKPTDSRRAESKALTPAEMKKILKRETVTLVTVDRVKGDLHYNVVYGKTPRTYVVKHG